MNISPIDTDLRLDKNNCLVLVPWPLVAQLIPICQHNTFLRVSARKLKWNCLSWCWYFPNEIIKFNIDISSVMCECMDFILDYQKLGIWICTECMKFSISLMKMYLSFFRWGQIIQFSLSCDYKSCDLHVTWQVAANEKWLHDIIHHGITNFNTKMANSQKLLTEHKPNFCHQFTCTHFLVIHI